MKTVLPIRHENGDIEYVKFSITPWGAVGIRLPARIRKKGSLVLPKRIFNPDFLPPEQKRKW